MSTDGGGGLSVSGETASLKSLTGSISATTTTTLGGTESANVATSSSTGKPPRKALQYAARTLPHLNFNRPSSNNNNTASAAATQQEQHQNSRSTMFYLPNASNSQKSEDAGGVTPTATTVGTGMRRSVDAEGEGENLVAMTRPPERRSRVAMLQPLMATAIHHEPLASITFREDAILTSDRRGHIKVWKRPARPLSSSVPGNGGSYHS